MNEDGPRPPASPSDPTSESGSESSTQSASESGSTAAPDGAAGEASGPAEVPPVPSWVDRFTPLAPGEFFEKYRARFTDRETGLPLGMSRAEEVDPYTIERLAFATGGTLRILLALFGPVCFGLFALSFVWDFEQGVLRACSIAGLIGFGTNWIAIKMLFWPREVRPIFGQGLIPSQREQIIEKVTNEVVEKLINEDLIRREIIESGLIRRLTGMTIERLRDLSRSEEFQADLKRLMLTIVSRILEDEDIRRQIVETAEKRLDELTSTSFKEWIILRFREVWKDAFKSVLERELTVLPETMDRLTVELDHVLEQAPAFLEQHSDSIDKGLLRLFTAFVREIDVRGIIAKQLEGVTSEELERGFREFADDKLSYITLLGGVLGFLGGFVIIWPLLTLLVLATALLFLAALDLALAPLMASRLWPQRGGAARVAPSPTTKDEV